MARTLGALVLETPDPRRLAAFYRQLPGWDTVGGDDGDDVVRLRAPEREWPGLSFLRDPDGHPFCLFLEGH